MSDLFTDDVLVDPAKDYLAELVGEGKKFSDPGALARAKAESDAFIARLERENAGLREEVTKRLSLEDAVKKITETKNLPEPDGDGNAAQVSTEQIAEIVQRKVQEVLTESTTASKKEANVETVVNTLREKFGDDFQRAVEVKRQALGLGKEFMTNLAETQPKAFLALVGVSDTKSAPASVLPQGTVNTAGFNSSNPAGEKGKKYFDELRTKDPRAYWSPKVQNDMHNQAIKLGIERFNSI